MRPTFQHNYKFVAGQTSPEDVLTNASYPASGSYIDMTGYEWVEVVIHLGAVDSALVFTLQQTDGAAGATLDTIDTVNCKKTIATTDADQIISMFLATENLAKDHHFITCTVSSAAGANDYGDILFFLGGARHVPVTQTTALCPSDNQLIKAG